jgi:hypothetical protein
MAREGREERMIGIRFANQRQPSYVTCQGWFDRLKENQQIS